MYKVNVSDNGKFSVAPGPRYCFSRKSAKKLAKFFYAKCGCEVAVYKLVHNKDVFFWTDLYEDVGFDVDELCEAEEPAANAKGE